MVELIGSSLAEQWPVLLWLLGGAFIAGTVDVISGGGGLISLPVLLLSGITPYQALAINKVQGSLGSGLAAWFFRRQGAIQFRELPTIIVMALLGGALGSVISLHIKPKYLNVILAILLIFIALYFILSKEISDEETRRRIPVFLFAATIILPIGVYDGFFGPSTGTFYMVSLIHFMGYSTSKALGTSKILNFCSNGTSALLFLNAGHLLILPTIAMCTGEAIGAYLGSVIAFRGGTKIIKPCIVITCIVISLKIIWESL
ncbi:TSUP family transporter [Candidatus Haliotispira prima]|uniref:Probable membrane transporter protein n=1 Tax=Candidatus Haliotispira prima TaxID=3034016 RepID=A0ABY8MK67_9SPIO|nr:TSUP family transporter [Candidatus Haliotispira prima]